MNDTIRKLIGGVQLPKFVKIRQKFDPTAVSPEQIPEAVRQQLSRPEIAETIKPGMTGGIQAQRRCILSLTEETHGNGYGMGAADVISWIWIWSIPTPLLQHLWALPRCR